MQLLARGKRYIDFVDFALIYREVAEGAGERGTMGDGNASMLG